MILTPVKFAVSDTYTTRKTRKNQSKQSDLHSSINNCPSICTNLSLMGPEFDFFLNKTLHNPAFTQQNKKKLIV